MLRAARVGDLMDVAKWIRSPRECELWAGWRVTFPIDVADLPRAIEFSETNSFCLVEGRHLLGFGQLLIKERNRGHLARLIVKPAVRGHGYGEALVRGLSDVGRVRGCERLSLNVDAANEPAVRLYLKLGFLDAPRPPNEPEAVATRYLERPDGHVDALPRQRDG